MAKTAILTVTDQIPVKLATGPCVVAVSSANAFMIGGPDVTPTSGLAIPGGVVFTLPWPLATLEEIHGIAVAGRADVTVMRSL